MSLINNQKPSSTNEKSSAAPNQAAGSEGVSQFTAPSISLPKGGGAIRGIGEKFAANPVTGTGSMTVPIAVSPGREGFGPQLSLSYDSGGGNGPFGLGWNLSLPSITRKTDKGLPLYNDQDESDVFILSGAEDLVPVLDKNGTIIDTERDGYRIRRYRPRIDGLFARIERWTGLSDGDIHWRSISKDNLLTVYGSDNNSRIADPTSQHRIFSWMICETRDDNGNGIIYEYLSDNSVNVDLSQVNEANRGDALSPLRTCNRYIKRIRYGNKTSLLDSGGKRPLFLTSNALNNAQWMFEIVLDYGDEPYIESPEDTEKRIYVQSTISATPGKSWPRRSDPFSTYRSGFEVRAYRLCRRALMFHHFKDELGVDDYLVRSTEFKYEEKPIASFITSVKQSGYVRQSNGSYLKKSLPPVEFEYSKAEIQNEVREFDADSLENLPIGLDGASYQWIDLDGDGVAGILTEQGGGWFYKRNLSPLPTIQKNGDAKTVAKLAPVETVAIHPSFNQLANGGMQFLDLAGDGQPDLVQFDGPVPGYFEHVDENIWETHRPFKSLPNVNWRDPNLKFIDLTGDGHTDILISEDSVFTWYPSQAEEGFGPSVRVYNPFDEEKGPRLIFADTTQSIFIADLSGDGLTDIVRIRNGEICYWPNLGYGRFGAKVTMGGSPWFDTPGVFDQRRIRLADIDGSGVTDIIYLGSDGIQIYFNQSGNSWSEARKLDIFPTIDNLSSITVVDLLGNGTASLVWSSPLHSHAQRPMLYVDLMGEQKPHLMLSSKNNLGAETRVSYAASTKFYLEDKYAGKPWLTKLPFPVHVVERVETIDHISNHHFVTSYNYRHGYFDGVEREFRGFGMVEQWDTDKFNQLDQSAANVDASWYAPPVHTKTWFHTGAYFRRKEISRQFAHEYFGAPKDEIAFEAWAKENLLDDTVFPDVEVTADEQRQAVRALKGAMLRQEVYADDAPDGAEEEVIKRSHTPYLVTEQNFTIELLQSQRDNRHAVFFTHPRESISHHYERQLDDPRTTQAITLEVDSYGNVLKSLAIGYGRKQSPLTEQRDKIKQTTTLITYTENRVTNAIDDATKYPVDYHVPLPAETRTYELAGFKPNANAPRFVFTEFVENDFYSLTSAIEVPYEKPVNATQKQKRLIEHIRTLYRKDDLTSLLALATLEPRALMGESYKLALTPGLVEQIFKRKREGQSDEMLLPSDPSTLLTGKGVDQGGYILMEGNWWISSGRIYFDSSVSAAAQELSIAQQHFYLPKRFVNPFDHWTIIEYDTYDLLPVKSRDELNNVVESQLDYRVLQPKLITDPNGNRAEASFDALGLVTATVIKGKKNESFGDLLEDFDSDLTLAALQKFIANPRDHAQSLLGKATTRIIYDMDRFIRYGQAPFAATLARETHFLAPGGPQTKIQISFSYSDGFGREIQKKIQAEAGDAPARQIDLQLPNGDILPGVLILDASDNMTLANTEHRWVGSGRTVFNNKGKPVKQYEPFFSSTHLFEEEREMTDTGVSPVLFYDPLERVIATLHPNNTYEKVVFDPWQQTTFDVNDTVAPKDLETGDPRTDKDINGYVLEYFKDQANDWNTWHAQRTGNQRGGAEKDAAEKAAKHAATPTVAYFDTLGRTFLTIVDNGVDKNGSPRKYATRIELDIEGNQREVIDAKNRIVMRYDYDMLGTRIHQASMEAGERWMLNDATGKPIRAWDSRGFIRRITYDELRRPTGLFVVENGVERLAERTVYGESQRVADNHRTRVYQVFDGAGVVTSEAYDFKGNLMRGKRELLPTYKQVVDWQLNPIANYETYTSSTEYDALNRPLSATAPDGSVYRPAFNDANLLEKVDVKLGGSADFINFVSNINYNAKGQRELITYKNGAETKYEYDPLTDRLKNLKTTRTLTQGSTLNRIINSASAALGLGDANALTTQLFNSAASVQNLKYTYDPVGNITRIEDAALKTIFHNNEQIEAVNSYTYDPIYRLIEAKGREHIGQNTFDFNLPENNKRDYPFFGIRANTNDAQAMRNYTEQYEYDEVGNFITHRHLASSGNWNRDYFYEEPSLIESGKKNNRLTRTQIGGSTETYTYNDTKGNDVHGCMTAINSMEMTWDFEDQLQQVNLGGGGIAYYVYDASGQRVRKVIESQNGARSEERIYLGGFEVYHKFNGGANVKLERETLHIMDDKQRIALVETKTKENDNVINSLQPVLRYQLGNHLGSASLELDREGGLISYEEYHSYGTTSFQTGSSVTEVSLKRYRYTGKERDEETGFAYHGARYYAAWIGRWVSCDPINIKSHINLYIYCDDRPLINIDINGMWAILGLVIVVALIIVAIEHPANAPSTEDVKAGKVENRPSLEEDLTIATVTAGSGKVGQAIGKSVANQFRNKAIGTITGGTIGGAGSGVTNAIGQQAIDDTKKGEMSSPGTYLDRAKEEGLTNAAVGGTLAAGGEGLKKVASSLKSANTPKPPSNPYDKKAWDSFMKANPTYKRGVGSDANKDIQPKETKAQADTRVEKTRQKYLESGGKINVIQDEVQLHHIASDKAIKSGWTAKFEELFQKARMTLNDDANLVSVESHKASHGPDYHSIIYKRLSDAVAGKTAYSQEYKDALVTELRGLKQDILRKDSSLNVLVTRK